LFVDRPVVDLEKFAVRREEVGSRHPDAAVLGDGHPIRIEVVREWEVELVEEQSGTTLVVVVVDPDERHLITELGMGLSEQGRLGPAGETPGGPNVHDGGAVQVCQHLLETGQVDFGKRGSGGLGLAVGTTGADEQQGDQKAAHPIIMGLRRSHPAAGAIRPIMDRLFFEGGGTVTESRGGPATVAVAAGAGLVALGLWAMIVPQSFFEAVATFEPYNQHFLQDIGAFQIGLGATLLLAGLKPSLASVTVALVGVGLGAAFHAISHVVGIDLGGKPATDIPVFTVVALVLLWAGAVSWRRQKSRS
jgi:hypothetical protein